MVNAWNWSAYAVAAVLVVGGLALVTVWDEAPDGAREFAGNDMFEGEDEDAGVGTVVDLSWWTGAGAVVLGVLVGVWAFWDDSVEDEYEEY